MSYFSVFVHDFLPLTRLPNITLQIGVIEYESVERIISRKLLPSGECTYGAAKIVEYIARL